MTLVVKDFSKVFLMTEGIKNILYEIQDDHVTKSYDLINKTFVRYRRMADPIIRIDYFENYELRNVIENTLDNFYEIEFALKQRAFKDASTDPNDEALKNAASALSLKAIPFSNECEV